MGIENKFTKGDIRAAWNFKRQSKEYQNFAEELELFYKDTMTKLHMDNLTEFYNTVRKIAPPLVVMQIDIAYKIAKQDYTK